MPTVTTCSTLCYTSLCWLQDTEELTRTLTVSKDYVFSLHVKQFLSHLDLEMLFQNCPTLCHLDMTYGLRCGLYSLYSLAHCTHCTHCTHYTHCS